MSASRDFLGDLHRVVAEELMNRIRNGDANTADFSAAIKFLKDNGIEAVTSNDQRLTDLARSLPEFINEDEPEEPTYSSMN